MRRERDLSTDRLTLGAAAVLSLTEAARILPGNEAANREWMRAQGLTFCGPSGAELVVWADVLDALPRKATRKQRGRPESSGPRPPEGRISLRRAP